jgi:23S rRNA (uracil1939-C5)-methyltransferase
MQKYRNRQKSFQNNPSQQNIQKKFEKETITAFALSTDGRAIGRSNDNVIVFIKDMLPEETAKIEIISKKSNYKNAILSKIETASPNRVIPPCIYTNHCGGCQLQHISQNMQTEYKTKWFLETLKRIGKWNESFIKESEKIISIVFLKREHYRRRVRLHFDGKNLGFKEAGSNKVTEIEHCLIASLNINDKIKFIKENLLKSFKEIQEKKVAQKIECEIEATESDDGKVILHLASVSIEALNDRDKCIKIFEKNLEINNEQGIHLKHPELPRFKIKKQSFVQPHIDCIKFYYQHMQENIDNFLRKFTNSPSQNEKILAWDLYSGAGVFTSLPYFSGKRNHLEVECLGIEGIKEAIDSLNNNHKNYPIQGQVQDVESFIESQFQLKISDPNQFAGANIIILDPPRSGCSISTMQKIVEVCSKKALILYLACDPASFSRDTRVLLEGGFKIKSLSLFDSFGHTTHYEVLGCFEKSS